MSQSFVIFASPTEHVNIRKSAHREENAHVWVPFFIHVLEFIEFQAQKVIFVRKWTGTVQSDFLVAFDLIDKGFIAYVLEVGVDTSTEKNLVIAEVRGKHKVVRRMGKLIVKVRGL